MPDGRCGWNGVGEGPTGALLDSGRLAVSALLDSSRLAVGALPDSGSFAV